MFGCCHPDTRDVTRLEKNSNYPFTFWSSSVHFLLSIKLECRSKVTKRSAGGNYGDYQKNDKEDDKEGDNKNGDDEDDEDDEDDKDDDDKDHSYGKNKGEENGFTWSNFCNFQLWKWV